MTEELYINGHPVDLPAGTLISLEYTNSVLSGSFTVASSHSYTVRLPSTENNRKVFNDPANVVQAASTQRLSFYDARYYRNEIDILGQCRAALLSYADTIEIALYWGGWPAYSEWAAKERTLNDVGGVTDASIRMSTAATRYQTFTTNGYGLVNYSYRNESGALVTNAVRPAILVTKMLQLIEQDITAQTGVATSIDTTRAHINGTDIMTFGTSVPTESASKRFTGTQGRILPVGAQKNRVISTVYTDPGSILDGDLLRWRVITPRMRVRVSGLMAIPAGASFSSLASHFMAVMGVDSQGSEQILATQTISVYTSAQLINVQMDEIINTAGYEHIYITLPDLTGEAQAPTSGPYATISIDPLGDSAITGDLIPLAGNLGPMKATDFIKSVCDYYGLVCIPHEPSATLQLISWQELLQTIPEDSLDWTDKLNGNGIEGTIRSAKSDLGQFAQHNILKWSNDTTQDDGLLWYKSDGDMKVQNILLEPSRVMGTLPWAPTNGDRMTPRSEESKMKQRIGHLVPLGTQSPVTFPAAFIFDINEYLPSRITSKYTALKTMLDNAYELSVFVRLTEEDLRSFHGETPVYFQQFGHYYIITNIKTDNSTDLAQVTMFQI